MFSFRYEFRKRYGTNYTQACAELGKSVRTLQRYYRSDKCDPSVKIILQLLNQNYVHPSWQDCYWRPDGNLSTPFGITTYSDILLVHRYKWHSKNASFQLNKLKNNHNDINESLQELQDLLSLSLSKIASRKLG